MERLMHYWLTLVMVCPLWVGGCASLRERVEPYLVARRYEDALQLLENEGAGRVLSEDASEQAIAARELFSDAVSEHYVEISNSELQSGNARKAEVKRYCHLHNIHLIWTPTNASWLNPIECQFTPLKEFVFRNRDYDSHAKQNLALRRYVNYRNKHAHKKS
ncbi:MAG: transposase [Phycisphaerales bacterium]|nr:MAG: transposase [Phycisphaerales bacterium]